MYPAYSLEVVVSRSHTQDVERIAATLSGSAAVREVESPGTGWARLIVSTDDEAHLVDLQAHLRTNLDFHLVYCEDRVLAASRGGKTRTHTSVRLEDADDLAIAYTPGVGRVSTLVAGDVQAL